MGTSLKITYAVLCVIGATLIILKNADRAWTYGSIAANYGSNNESRSTLVSLQIDFQDTKSTIANAKLDNEYEPPNYGGPDGSYGSATR
ncbi:hypothetical protein QUB80_34470 [Chlorogloeopsis sp. ULAP01]|uniref:hypothetical protein n=1 Tax=Chlorogloeopsis sp. ULAP01 TaxID=3056483 RepID=UPI0025AAE539|nr:hypothetical protein [Chlorogloeopsis sp. ULAP01]MDM9385762.1 hypothetical protein [Chlorogloeopsis sp. ULAP01]